MLNAKVFRVFNPTAAAILEDNIYSLTDFFTMEQNFFEGNRFHLTVDQSSNQNFEHQ